MEEISRVRRVAVLFVVGLLPMGGFAATAPSGYAGSESCRGCHAANFTSQSKTAHARSLARSVPGQPGDWAFGAGLHATTFLTKIDRESWREEGLTWYRSLNGYAISPGHRDTKGIVFRTFDPAARILSCFACHSTGPLSLGKDDEVIPHEAGVHCEVCHGPAAAHVSDPKHNALRTPAQLTAVAMNGFCGKCHRLDSEAGEEVTDLRDPRNARIQPLRLAASVCFLRSNGRLNCLTCHSPHQELDSNPASYDARCQTCHARKVHRQQIAGQACVSCHMPRVANSEYLSFANHRIAVYAADNPLVPVASKR